MAAPKTMHMKRMAKGASFAATIVSSVGDCSCHLFPSIHPNSTEKIICTHLINKHTPCKNINFRFGSPLGFTGSQVDFTSGNQADEDNGLLHFPKIFCGVPAIEAAWTVRGMLVSPSAPGVRWHLFQGVSQCSAI